MHQHRQHLPTMNMTATNTNRTFLRITILIGYLLCANTLFAFTRQDTLRGSNGRGRSWWDVQKYELSVAVNTTDKNIDGSNKITAKIVGKATDSLQLDLQELMFLDSVIMDGQQLVFSKEGNVWWIKHAFSDLPSNHNLEFTTYYHGKPRSAKNPPWDGGFIWTKDEVGHPWIAVACQGLGASSWWPCKDYQGDEPDSGMIINYSSSEVLDFYSLISNGVHNAPTQNQDQQLEYPQPYRNTWTLKNPINTYNTTFYIGNYISWKDTMMGEKGILNLSFYPLKHNVAKAHEQFAVTKQMLHCFEYWMGPYPFYEDGYKLVEAPYLGMEHQSAVAYGNDYKMGYRGTDRSGTGVGMLFDYIIVHESGHEWFGNNITAQDVADNWLHEGFTTYTETLFAEWIAGKDKAFQYQRGERNNIMNTSPIIGAYGVNDDGSPDKYDKGSTLVHMIRMMIGDDEKFRQLLRGLNRDFYHKIVTSAEVEAYISRTTGIDFTAVFNQYLRTTSIPKLDWYIKKKRLHYRFTDVVDGFTMPIPVSTGNKSAVISPTAAWQDIKWKRGFNVRFSPDFLIRLD